MVVVVYSILSRRWLKIAFDGSLQACETHVECDVDPLIHHEIYGWLTQNDGTAVQQTFDDQLHENRMNLSAYSSHVDDVSLSGGEESDGPPPLLKSDDESGHYLMR